MTTNTITVSDLEIMAGAVNYRTWMLRRFAPYLGQRILEVGAGIGNFTELLLDRELVLPTDVYPPCVERLQDRIGHRLKADPVVIDLADPAIRQLASHRFDTVLCTNVLEHVADDRASLANIFGVLQPGGRLLLYVPAHPILYGTVDASLDHFRRYTRRDVAAKLTGAGFTVEHLSEMNAVGTIAWFLNGRVLRRREESVGQVTLFDRWIVPWMERVERVAPPPFGLSILGVGRKGGQTAENAR
jgi:2-polyprenyl-3-methyl-5-hydroxy-6-metoxy-1,4-benzoquinol methylase